MKACLSTLILFSIGLLFFSASSSAGPLEKDFKLKEKDFKPKEKDFKPKESPKPAWQKYVERSKERVVSGRENGVLLRAVVEAKKEGKGLKVLIHWSLDYDGPRCPLIILKPSLESYASRQCGVSFFAVDKVDDIPIVTISPVVPGFITANPAKELFLIIQKNEVAKATIEIPLGQVEGQFREKFPGRFPKFPPIHLFA